MSVPRFIERKVIAPILLGIVFFLVILPIGLVMRLLRIDPMARGFDAESDSYRTVSKQQDAFSLERTR